jgi:hypothetical protein
MSRILGRFVRRGELCFAAEIVGYRLAAAVCLENGPQCDIFAFRLAFIAFGRVGRRKSGLA